MDECFDYGDGNHLCVLPEGHEGTHRCCCLEEW
jgi:hypothetical protein